MCPNVIKYKRLLAKSSKPHRFTLCWLVYIKHLLLSSGWRWYSYSLLIMSVIHIVKHVEITSVSGTGFWVSVETGDTTDGPEAHLDGCASLSFYRCLSVDLAPCPPGLWKSPHSAFNMRSPNFSFMHIMHSFIPLLSLCHLQEPWMLEILHFKVLHIWLSSKEKHFWILSPTKLSFGYNRWDITLFYGFRCVLLISNICFVVIYHWEITQRLPAFVPLQISLM